MTFVRVYSEASQIGPRRQENSAFQVTRNPHDLDRIPGGSSGGSAAVVAANRVINPHAVAVGLREAMHTAILGLLVLFIATTVWLILDTILRRAARRAA